ncbi:hypothetical protein QJS04_geneDACA003024 [Acorus gramineus]|uniref:Uncharacterized protein n=1 Tax=Acorus gramineus TaxID=55184 RepID=A0AAV9BUW2_ACOGR|nr:hypothetical protein QJS04_geneDACA003024 [Acorus gramineus]
MSSTPGRHTPPPVPDMESELAFLFSCSSRIACKLSSPTSILVCIVSTEETLKRMVLQVVMDYRGERNAYWVEFFEPVSLSFWALTRSKNIISSSYLRNIV